MVFCIIAQITGSGPETSVEDGKNIIVRWSAKGEDGTDIGREESFTVVLPLTDIEIETNVRAQLADRVSQLSGHTYLPTDVLGCKL